MISKYAIPILALALLTSTLAHAQTSPPEAIAKASAAVGWVGVHQDFPNGQIVGTAFYIGNKRWVTSSDVAGTANSRCVINAKDGTKLYGKVVLIQPGDDGCALIETLDDIPIAPLRFGTSLSRGESVYICGVDFLGGTRRSAMWTATADSITSGYWELVAPANSVRRSPGSGNSGGPVLNHRGEVVSIQFATTGLPDDALGRILRGNTVTVMQDKFVDFVKQVQVARK